MLAFDNISDLAPSLSDGLCRLATGSGFATRELYSDDDEMLFAATRPIILNGIGEIVTRPDLLDRSLLISLPPIPESRRRDERELLQRFAATRPRILGALLDAVAEALRNRDGIRLPGMPRMADFARWVTAAEAGLGWPVGSFLTAYDANRTDAHELALETSPIPSAVRSLIAGAEGWEGTASELLLALADHVEEPVRRGRDWPSSPRALSAVLRRIAPNFRAIGVEVEFARGPDSRRRRLIRIIQKIDGRTVQTVQSAVLGPDALDGLDGVSATATDEGEL